MQRASARTVDPLVPLLVFSGISAQAAAFAATATMAQVGFSLLVHLALLAGLVVSLRNLRRRFPLDWLAYAAIALALLAFNLRRELAATALLYPDASLNDPNLLVAALLVWILVAFGFVQYRRRNVIFVSACGLAIFGLIGVINLEPGVFVAFLVYLFATIMTWSYEALTARAAPGAAAMWWRVARGQATSAATVLVGVAAGAFLVSSLLYLAIPSPFGVPTRVPRMWSWAGSLVQGNFLLNSRLAVGAGPAALGGQVLFRVRAEMPGLWRTSVYDHYDGHSWSRTLTGRRAVRRSPDGNFRLAARSAPSVQLNRQQFWVEAGTSGAVLAAAHPVEVRFDSPLWGAWVATTIVDDYGCLTSSPVTQPGGGYTVISVVPESDPARLRAAGTAYPPWMRRLYIEDLPLAAQSALQELAMRLTADAQTSYDKAVAIQTYLEDNYYYTEDEPVTPADQDAAVFFLLESKRGACDLFATSMAVLLRLSGVPARVATGFVSGEYDPDTASSLIRARDAHAWVEVYFPGYDWIPFNPAPQRELEKESLWTLLRRGQSLYAVTQMAKAVGLGALVVVLAGLLLMAAVDPRLVQARLRELRWRRSPWERAAREANATSRALLAAWRVPPGPAGETPLEALGRISLAVPGAAATGSAHLERLRSLLGEYYRLRYGPTAGNSSQVLAVARELRNLRRRLPRHRR